MARIWSTLIASAKWAYHLPGRTIDAIGRAFNAITREIGKVLFFSGKVLIYSVATAVALSVAFALGTLLWSCYTERKERLERAREREERERYREDEIRAYHEQRQARIEEEQLANEGRAREAEARRQREAHNQKQRAEAERQRRENIQRRQDFLKKQLQAEDAKHYEKWRAYCDEAFKSAQPLATGFPEPHHWPCDHIECEKIPRALKACKHSLHRILSAPGDLEMVLKIEQKRWHPNGASGVRIRNLSGENGKANREKAEELSQVIQSLLDDVLQKS